MKEYYPMDIVVCVKQVLDTRLLIEVTEQGEVVQREPWPIYVFNPADRCALQEAVRLKSAGDCHITAMTLGPSRAGAVLAHCLARGVDRVVHLLTDEQAHLDSFSVARVLSAEIRKRSFDLILCGNRTEDDGASEVGPVLAELLDIPQVTNVVKLELSVRDRMLVAERKLERGYRQVVEAGLPALVTVDSSICQPMYVTQRASRCAVKSLAQNGTLLPIQDATLLAFGRRLRQVVGISPPRPRPKKIAQPDGGMSPAERIAMVMGMGGGAPKKSNQRASGGAESLADEIIGFLKEKGLLA